jgi:hypothetical protein
VVTAFDGETITIREFATGKKVTAKLDTECTPAQDSDATADESTVEDDGFVEVDEDEGFAGFFQEEEEEEDVDVDADASTCSDDELEKGLVLQSAELEDGFLVDYTLA